VRFTTNLNDPLATHTQLNRYFLAMLVAIVLSYGVIGCRRSSAVPVVARNTVVPELGAEFAETKNNLNLIMQRVPAGSFMMGSPDNEGYKEEHPQHRVTVKSFYIGKYEITQAQWQAVMGNNPAKFTGDLIRPVENVSWNDTQEFCRKLNALTGQTYSLPSEAEWEYAARAGTTGAYAGEIDAMGWHHANAGGTTHPVGQKLPNAFGLFDMHGNVWEWCEDTWKNSYHDMPTDGASWLKGSDRDRLLRGGAWDGNAEICRSAVRNINAPPSDGFPNLGFRVVLSARTP
jgi:formylglycine-generating enzyme required for sulfatase activity